MLQEKASETDAAVEVRKPAVMHVADWFREENRVTFSLT
jgi:hypothetical protein